MLPIAWPVHHGTRFEARLGRGEAVAQTGAGARRAAARRRASASLLTAERAPTPVLTAVSVSA